MKKIVSLLLTLMLAVEVLLTGCTDPKELYDNEDTIAGGSSLSGIELGWRSLTDDGTIDYTPEQPIWLVLNWRFPLPSMQSQLMLMYMTPSAAVSEVVDSVYEHRYQKGRARYLGQLMTPSSSMAATTRFTQVAKMMRPLL